MMSNHNRNKTIKIIVITLGVLLLIAAGAGIWLSTHYKQIIRKNLPDWVAEASDSLYHVSITDIGINLVTNKVMLKGVKLWPDTARLRVLQQTGGAPNTILNIDIPGATIKGIDFASLVGSSAIGCNSLYILKPKATVTAIATDTVSAPGKEKSFRIKKIGTEQLVIQHADITYSDHRTADSNTTTVKGGNIEFTDWYIKPGDKNNRAKKFYGKLGNVAIDSLGYATKDGFYTVTCGRLEIDGSQTTVNDFRLKTPYSKKEFYEKAGKQKEIYTIHFPLVRLHDFEPEKMLNENTLNTSLIELEKAYIDIYFSRVPPPNTKSKIGNFPNQLVQKFGVRTFVDSVDIKDGRFRYTEKSVATMREGSFSIQRINGGISHVTNVHERLQENNTCTIRLKGSFMGQSSIAATFKLDLTDTLGGFTVSGEHKNLDAGEIHEMVKALAVADLQSMHASSVKFTVTGNQYAADGNMTMLYDDLKIKLLKIEDDKELKKQGFISFIARATLIYEGNPQKGGEPRSVTMRQERRPTGSFFNLIWKTLFEGMTETMLRTKGAAEFVQDAKPGKKKDKGIIKTIKQVFKDDKKEKK